MTFARCKNLTLLQTYLLASYYPPGTDAVVLGVSGSQFSFSVVNSFGVISVCESLRSLRRSSSFTAADDED